MHAFSGMQLIKNWLSGKRNFVVGTVLYKKFGTDEKLKKLFDGKPDAYKEKRLAEELEKLLQRPKLVLQQTKKPNDAEEMPASSDPVLKAIREEWLPIYQRMNYLRHELDKYEGNGREDIAKRSPICFEILAMEQKCMAIWAKRGYYEKNGLLPELKEVKKEVPTDPVQLGKMIETLKRNIRRNKQLAERNPGKAQYPLLVKQYENELEEIMKTVNDGKQSA